MYEKMNGMKLQRPGNSWWAQASRRAKVVISTALVALVILALSLGLGLGLTVGKGNGSDQLQPRRTPLPSLLPPTPINSNIWQPAVNSTWQIELLQPLKLDATSTSVSPDVDIFDIDLFDNPKSTIDALHRLGKKAICYFSAGSYEPGRPDSKDFQPSDQGNGLQGWAGERWLDLKSDNVRNIMSKRIELAAQNGCDAIDPDNVDAYDNDNGLGLTPADSINFLYFLALKAQSLNLAIGLKNAGTIIPSVLPAVQFSVNEQCVQNSECDVFSAFPIANKPVFHIEYPKEVDKDIAQYLCEDAGPAEGAVGFSTVLKNLNLDGWVQYCDGSIANTATTGGGSY